MLAPFNPVQNNGYSYAGNNPITSSDPSGNCSTSDDSSGCWGHFIEPVASEIAAPAPGANSAPPKHAPSPSAANNCDMWGCGANAGVHAPLDGSVMSVPNVLTGDQRKANREVLYSGGELISSIMFATCSADFAQPICGAGAGGRAAIFGATKLEDAVTEANAASRIMLNKAAGDAARDAIAAENPGSRIETTFSIPNLGVRRVDVLTPGGVAIESKVGYTGLTSVTRAQISKDLAILQREPSVTNVQWVFTRSDITGRSGPSPALQNALDDAGIMWSER